jgi:hypothetical protein
MQSSMEGNTEQHCAAVEVDHGDVDDAFRTSLLGAEYFTPCQGVA